MIIIISQHGVRLLMIAPPARPRLCSASVDAARERITWATSNKATYSRCFMDEANMSDSAVRALMGHAGCQLAAGLDGAAADSPPAGYAAAPPAYLRLLAAPQADIVKADRLPAVLAALERLVKASTAGGKQAPQQAAAGAPAAAAQLTLRRAGDSVYLGAGACSFKFAILSNDRLLA